MARVLVIELRVELVDSHWFLVGLDDRDDFVHFIADGLFVAIFGDADSVMILVVFRYNCQDWGDFAEEAEVGFFDSVWFVAKNLLGEVGSACDATHFGEIADDKFFGWSEIADFPFFGCDAETDKNRLF